jgi:protease-4
MRYAWFIVLLIFSIIAVQVSADPIDGIDYQAESVAAADRTTAGLINPAGIGFSNLMGMEYIHSFTDSTYGGDDAFLLASKSGFFSLEWLKRDTGIFRRKFTAGLGDRVLPNFYFGLTYSWFGGSDKFYKGKKDWKIGLLYHPRPFVSIGFILDRINEPKFNDVKSRRLYQPGLAIRPFGEKLTISGDARWLEGKKLAKIQGNVRVSIGPFKGVSLVSAYRSEGQWRFGLSFDFQQTRIGAQGRFVRESHYGGGNFFIEQSAARFPEGIGNTPKTGDISLGGDFTEEPRQRPILGAGKKSFLELISALHNGATDPRITSLLIKFDNMNLDFASAQEIRNALSEYRSNGKKVTVFMTQGGNLAYYLASVSDAIYMDPTGLLELKGLAATAQFYKGTMDKLGIKAEVVRTGPHKTYGDTFTDSTLSPEAREQIDWLLDDLYSQFVEGISTGRRILPEKIKELIDHGPYTAQDAYKAGLIDGLKHYDELSGEGENGAFTPHTDLLRFYGVDDYNPRWSEPKKLAVVYADGTIMTGKSGTSLLEGKTVGSSTLAGAIKKIRNDHSIKGVVFRVNSPGGDVFAAEEIYRQLELIKGKKPLVVSMGGVAASGGYYISCPGDEIIASPGTITGSIGVVMGKPDLSGFYSKIGIHSETLKRGEHADIRSTSRPSTPEELALVEKMLWEYYDDFLNKVSTWRQIETDSVNAIGQGRVWTGRQAKDRGLVDTFGGIWDALDQVRQKAQIDPEDKLELEIFPTYGISLSSSLSMPSLETQISSLLNQANEDKLYFKPPFEIQIK